MFLKVVVPATQVLNYKSCLKVTTTREIFRHSSPDILYLLGTKMYESFFLDVLPNLTKLNLQAV